MGDLQLAGELSGSTEEGVPLGFDIFSKLHFDISDGMENMNHYDPDYNFLFDMKFSEPTEYCNASDYSHMTKPNSMGIYFQNINGFKSNFQSFEIHILPNIIKNFSFFGFTETKMLVEEETRYDIPNFNLYANNNPLSYGGVALFIREDIVCNIIPNLSHMSAHFESIFIECTIDKTTFVLGVIYRRPNTNMNDFNDTLTGVLDILRRKRCKCYLMGDYNLNLLNYDQNGDVQQFLNSMYSFGFYNTINRPTRVTSHSATLIDNIFTNDINTNIKTGIFLTDISDHFAPFNEIEIGGNPQTPKTVTLTYPDYNHSSPEDIEAIIARNIQDIEFEDIDVNTCYDKLSAVLQTSAEECFPIKTRKIKTNKISKPWLTDDILEYIKERHKLYKKFIKKPITFGQEYRNYRNHVNQLINRAKITYFQNKLIDASGSCKNTWKVLNKILGRATIRKTNISSLKFDEETYTDQADICKILNKYFSQVGTQLANQLMENEDTLDPMSYMRGEYNEFEYDPITEEEIKTVVKKLKDSGPGDDMIHIKLIKIGITAIAPVLVNIFLTRWGLLWPGGGLL